MSKQTVTMKERLAIYDKLKEVCHKTEGEFCAYDEGWSDRALADHFGCSLKTVQNMRQEGIGNLRKYSPPTGDTIEELKKKVEEQGQRIERLEQAMKLSRIGTVTPMRGGQNER